MNIFHLILSRVTAESLLALSAKKYDMNHFQFYITDERG